jgi:chorismate dehydratase
MNVGTTPRRLGVVSFLNAKPLIAGLERDASVELVFAVPSRLPAMLDAGDIDVGLVPVIDIGLRRERWRIVSDACIGCDGETLTVRVFSRVPARRIERLHVDGDSHTSVALARIIWREMHGIDLEIVPYTGSESAGDCHAVLLIGDKVVNHGLIGYDIQTDLGSAWKSLTSLPFVFAAWAAPVGSALGDVESRLQAARDRGVASAEMIAADFGPGMGWPVALAKRYLSARLRFTIGDRYLEAMDRFLELATRHEVIVDSGAPAIP